MAKRISVNTKNKASHSRKTKKRLAVKKEMLDAKRVLKGPKPKGPKPKKAKK
jgi:hypothetical protein